MNTYEVILVYIVSVVAGWASFHLGMKLARRQLREKFYRKLAHGDDAHRAWLMAELTTLFGVTP